MLNLQKAFELSLRSGVPLSPSPRPKIISPAHHKSCKGKVHGTGNYTNGDISPTKPVKNPSSVSSYDGCSDTDDSEKQDNKKQISDRLHATRTLASKAKTKDEVDFENPEPGARKRKESLRKILEQKPNFRYVKNGVICVEDINSSDESIKKSVQRKITPRKVTPPQRKVTPPPRKVTPPVKFRHITIRRKVSVKTVSWKQLMDIATNKKVNCGWSDVVLLKDLKVLQKNRAIGDKLTNLGNGEQVQL